MPDLEEYRSTEPSPQRPLAPDLIEAIRRVVGPAGISTDPSALLVYESDGLTTYRAQPRAVILPRRTAEVAGVVRVLAASGTPFVARGAGTGLSGGALALEGAVVISLARLDRILELDPLNRRAIVEAGLVNAELSRAAAPHGLYYAPDPGSESACTIGGNVAENAGGPHCLKYGVTSNHVTGAVVVLPTGEVVELGGGGGEPVGYDLLGLFVGSEGTFGIVTEVEVRLLPMPEGVETLLALFDSAESASEAVSAIIAAGLLPAALEMIDHETISAVEASIFAAGLPTDLGAALVIEFDGARAGLGTDAERARALCLAAGAREVRRAENEAERDRLWQARKRALGALGRLAPDLLVQDAVVPRSRLAEVVEETYRIAERHGLRICNLFHAGDGNLHPTILFDRRDPDQLRRVEAASREIMVRSIEAGGTITGEHGVGLDKRGYMSLVHDDVVLRVFRELQSVFDPEGLANPGKILEPVVGKDRVEGGAGAGSDGIDGGDEGAVAGLRGTLKVPGRRARSPELQAMNAGIVEYNPADLVVSVAAGMTLNELQRELVREGQWLPLDPPGGTGLTIGEIVARGLSGPLRLGYGTPRDQVLGLQLRSGAGEVIECGGRVMKNVAGYDLVRLVVGSGGALGEVRRVDLRLRAIPGSDSTMVLAGQSPAPLLEVAGQIRAAPLGPVALELLSPPAWAGVGGSMATGDEWALLVRWQGNRDEVEAAYSWAEGLQASGSGIRLVAGEVVGQEASGSGRAGAGTGPAGGMAGVAGGVWASLAVLEGSAETIIRLADLPSATLDTLELAEMVSPADLPVLVHAGLGIIRVLVSGEVLGAGPDQAISWGAVDRARTTLESRRGSLIVHGRVPEAPAGRSWSTVPCPIVARLEGEIRSIFAPAGTRLPVDTL